MTLFNSIHCMARYWPGNVTSLQSSGARKEVRRRAVKPWLSHTGQAHIMSGSMLVGRVDKLVCLGKNYLAHAKELQRAIGDQVHAQPSLPAADLTPVWW